VSSTQSGGGVAVSSSTALTSSFDHHDPSSSCHRVSYGGSSDAHDASWLCVVNMADIHVPDSDTSRSAKDSTNRRYFETASSFSTKSPTKPQRIVPPPVESQKTTSDFTNQIQSPAALPIESRQVSRVVTMVTPSNVTAYRFNTTVAKFPDIKNYMSVQNKSSVTTSSCATISHATASSSSVAGKTPEVIQTQPVRPVFVITSVNQSNVNVVRSSRSYPKPAYSYSCLIAMALKNSATGVLPVNEIYAFMTENFPYFQTAPDGWKNSVNVLILITKLYYMMTFSCRQFF